MFYNMVIICSYIDIIYLFITPSARSLESEGGLLDNFSSSDFSWLLRKIADTSDMIATLHEEL